MFISEQIPKNLKITEIPSPPPRTISVPVGRYLPRYRVGTYLPTGTGTYPVRDYLGKYGTGRYLGTYLPT